MDPISAFALAGTVLTFVDCGVKLFKHAAEIYKSPKGLLSSHESIDRYSSEFVKSIRLVEVSQFLTTSAKSANDWKPLLDECTTIAKELSKYIDNMRTGTNRGKMQSLKTAVRSMASAAHVEGLLKRLEQVRAEVHLRLTIESSKAILGVTTDINQQLLDIKSHIELMSKRPKELGYAWETGLPKDHLWIDDGLDPPFSLPLDFCTTPQNLQDVLRVKYTSRDLPGRFQIERGHFTLFDWSETRAVSTHDDWTALITGDRRVKLAFAMSSPFGWRRGKCSRCWKHGISKSPCSMFKTCNSCGLSVRYMEPDQFAGELEDVVFYMGPDRYRDHLQDSRPKRIGQSPIPQATAPGTVPNRPRNEFNKPEPTTTPPREKPVVDLVAHRLAIKLEPMFNIVHRYLWCRCILRMTSPASCEREMTFPVLASCPRHNNIGKTFLDYGNRDYHRDPYFDAFGGYDMFKFMLFSCGSIALCSMASRLLGNEKFITDKDLQATNDVWQSLTRDTRLQYIRSLEEYWLEAFEEFRRMGTKLLPQTMDKLRKRDARLSGLGLSSSQVDDSGSLLVMNDLPEMPWVKEVEEILEGKWSGKPHWSIDD